MGFFESRYSILHGCERESPLRKLWDESEH